MNAMNVYIPIDRRHALARGEGLPDRAWGAALFADISGFTPLTEALARELGPRRGAEELTCALDRTLRSVINYAALTEAVLETRAVRLADPSTAPPQLVEALARQLSDAGLLPSFGPSWTLVSGAHLSVGTRGLEDALETFMASNPVWRRLSR